MASINLPEGFVIDNEPVEADREEMFGLPEGFVVDGVEAPEAPEAPEPVAAPTEPEPVEDAIGIGTYASEAGKAVVRGVMDILPACQRVWLLMAWLHLKSSQRLTRICAKSLK